MNNKLSGSQKTFLILLFPDFWLLILLSMHSWSTLDYLKTGDSLQQRSARLLEELDIFRILCEYDPLLVGTIPIGIYTDSSDLDIICHLREKKEFHKLIHNSFSSFASFHFHMDDFSYVAGFIYKNMPVEIYAEPTETSKQKGFRHMIVENDILELADEKVKQNIIQLKKEGLKTEPAFGRLLNLKKPYNQLLELGELSTEDLKKFLLSKDIPLKPGE
ncbi:MAG: DUF4269 domain-containing protein [Candidatus Azobacteroides sp.]|nr:DUF4269 domain-containing protein [Candidatus Azobacteroides sp.]